MKILECQKNDKLKSNLQSYREGCRDFSVQELNDIKLYISKYKECVDNTKFFTGNIKEFKVVSCLAESFFEELLSRMINNYAADIAIIVVASEKKVIYKKNSKTCKIDLCRLAYILSDGECDESSVELAGGNLTDNFIKLTKTFIQCI